MSHVRHVFVEFAVVLAVAGLAAACQPSCERRADGKLAPALDFGSQMPQDLPNDTSLIEYGLVPIVAGESPVLKLDLPHDAYTLFVLVYGHRNSSVILSYAEAPDGTVLVSNKTPARDQISSVAGPFPGQFYSRNRVLPSTVSGAFMIPNNPGVSLAAGTYRLRVGAYAIVPSPMGFSKTPVDLPVYVAFLIRRGTPPTQGKLRLVLSFGAGSGLTSATAVANEKLSLVLSIIRDAFAHAEVEIAVSYGDVSESIPRSIKLRSFDCRSGDLDVLLARGKKGACFFPQSVLHRQVLL